MTDLSGKKDTVTWVIQRSFTDIASAYEDETVTYSVFKSQVTTIIQSAKDTAGKKKILSILQKQNNKDDVMMYVSNTYLAGTNNSVINVHKRK